MEYKEKKKLHIYDLLYPFAARALGLKDLVIRNNPDFAVRYFSSKYCVETDNPDNALSHITVYCEFGKAGRVVFMPFLVVPTASIRQYGYLVFVNDEQVAKLSPMEWEIIRPKAYGDFTEYFSELSSAIACHQYVTAHNAAQPFIIKEYADFFASFRETLYNKIDTFAGDEMGRGVSFVFNSETIHGDPVVEYAVVAKTAIDNRMMVAVSSLN